MKLKRTSLVGAAILATALIAVVALASASGSSRATAVVKSGHALGKTVLVNRSGRTLYSLSAETRGRFICTGSCLSLWHPLVVKSGQKPTGARSLGTVRRPGGRTQVTYRGRPLYTFSGDRKRGDAMGEGLEDVGVWHAATVRTARKAPAPAPQQPTTTSPGYYGY